VIREETQFNIAKNLVQFRRANVLQAAVISFLSNILSSAESLHEYTQMFQMMDVTKDGFLTIDEIKKGIEMHHCAMYFEANDWAEVLHSMDADGNGKIDFTEFIAAAYNK